MKCLIQVCTIKVQWKEFVSELKFAFLLHVLWLSVSTCSIHCVCSPFCSMHQAGAIYNMPSSMHEVDSTFCMQHASCWLTNLWHASSQLYSSTDQLNIYYTLMQKHAPGSIILQYVSSWLYHSVVCIKPCMAMRQLLWRKFRAIII